MTAIAFTFWRICLFKQGPETLPASNFLLALVILMNAMVSWVASVMLEPLIINQEDLSSLGVDAAAEPASGFTVLSLVIVSLASTTALVWGTLSLMSHKDRVARTLMAIFGADVILTVLTAASVYFGALFDSIITQLAGIGMFLWTVAVYGFILHRALSVSMGMGIAAGLFIMIFTIAIGQVAIGV